MIFRWSKVGRNLGCWQNIHFLHEAELQGQVRTLIVIILGSDDRTGDVGKLPRCNNVQNHDRR